MALFSLFKKKAASGSEVKVSVGTSTAKMKSTEELREEWHAERNASVVPVEKRIKTATPSKQGLYPHEILALDYAPKYYVGGGNSFPGFWWYGYGVRDVQALLDSLEKRGFLRIGDLHTTLGRQKVTALKEVLKAYGNKQTGKKDDLIQRAIEEIPSDDLNQRFPQRTYTLTEIGKATLEEAAYVSYIHRHGAEDLDIWSLNQLVHLTKGTGFSYRDVIWRYLNERCGKHYRDRNYGLYRNCRFYMSGFLCEEGKTQSALAMLAEVVLWDLSGASNGYDPQHLEIFAKHFFPYENSLATTAPGIIAAILSCQEELGCSDEELKADLVESMSKSMASVPIQLFTVDECAQIVFMERDKDVEELTRMYARAKREFKKNHPGIKI